MSIIELLGQSTFQTVAIQFGIDQLEGASSKVLSAFINYVTGSEKRDHFALNAIFFFAIFQTVTISRPQEP